MHFFGDSHGCQLPLQEAQAQRIPQGRGVLVPPSQAKDQGGCLVFPGLLPPGTVLRSAADNIVGSFGDCCSSCRQVPTCNVFAQCLDEKVRPAR